MAQGLSLLFVVDPLDALKAYKDSSVAMMRESARRGHDVWTCQQSSLRWRDGKVTARCQLLEPLPQAKPWYALREEGDHGLDQFDAVLMRKDPPFDAEYLVATHLLEAAERQGARVFNAPRALRDHNEKLAITEFAEFIVPTLVSSDPAALRAFHAEFADIVVKPLDAMGGAGVFRLRRDDPNVGVILETVTHLGARTVMAQRFIPEIRDGDKRVLLIAGEPVPYVLARIPRPGETRGNLAAGGTGVARPLAESDRAIAARLGPVLAARGLLLVGLDVIGRHLTEVNVTSPTCLVEISEQTGCNVAALFVDALEKALARD
jgi:glutathione synthase